MKIILYLFLFTSCILNSTIEKDKLPTYNFPEKTIISKLDTSCLISNSEALLNEIGTIEDKLLNFFGSEVSYAEEKEFGDNIHKELVKEWRFVTNSDNDKLVSILSNMKKYVSRTEVNYKIFLIENPEDTNMVNAFTTAGGNIYVTTALVNSVESDDELAGIIGHEIGHNENKHCQKHIKKTNILSDWLPIDDDAANWATTVAETFTASFNQFQELESDKAGVYLAYKAGYDPAKVNDFFLRLSKKEEISEFNSLLRSHPFSESRYSCIEKYLSESRVD